MSDQNAKIVRDCWEVANRHDVSGFDAYYDENVVYYAGGSEEIRGRDNLKTYLQGYLDAFPDMHITIEDLFADGDKVFSRARAEGTNTGPLLGMPPTGKRMVLRWIMNVARLQNGKIVEEWEILDRMEILQQLGLVDATALGSPA